LGNIVAESEEETELVVENKLIKLEGETSILGRAVVVHTREGSRLQSNFFRTTDEEGKARHKEAFTPEHSGQPIACGLIESE
jgi:hypothetical protein